MREDNIVYPTTRTAATDPSAFVKHNDIESVVDEEASSDRPGQSGPNHDNRMGRFSRWSVGERPIGLHVEATHVGPRVALANQSKNGSGRMEGSVKQPVAPLNAHHRGWVSPIECVHVVEGLAVGQGLLHVLSPRCQGFPPCHPDVVV